VLPSLPLLATDTATVTAAVTAKVTDTEELLKGDSERTGEQASLG
jgi:hypothetical protein